MNDLNIPQPKKETVSRSNSNNKKGHHKHPHPNEKVEAEQGTSETRIDMVHGDSYGIQGTSMPHSFGIEGNPVLYKNRMEKELEKEDD